MIKRLLLSVVLATVLLLATSVTSAAQTADIDITTAIATTSCLKMEDGRDSVVSIIQMDVLHSRNMEEYEVHEAEHRRQFSADSTLCKEWQYVHSLDLNTEEGLKALEHWMPRLLQMEVEAYCVSARVPLRHGARRSAMYKFDLELLKAQFNGQLEMKVVEDAWANQCWQLRS